MDFSESLKSPSEVAKEVREFLTCAIELYVIITAVPSEYNIKSISLLGRIKIEKNILYFGHTR